MKKGTALLLLLFPLVLSSIIFAEPTPAPSVADAAVYGAYPENYKSVVLNWLADKLADFASADIVWGEAPKPAELPGKDGQKLTGYLVEFKVNSRNQFGAYTGMQKHGALIRDGKVIKATGFIF